MARSLRLNSRGRVMAAPPRSAPKFPPANPCHLPQHQSRQTVGDHGPGRDAPASIGGNAAQRLFRANGFSTKRLVYQLPSGDNLPAQRREFVSTVDRTCPRAAI